MTFTIPGPCPSASNLREHHHAKARRVASQRSKAMLLCPKWTHGPVLHITLTRVAPRELDSDNLAASMKAHRDGIAARLRIDDGSPLVKWHYDQEKGEECVRVKLELPGGQLSD